MGILVRRTLRAHPWTSAAFAVVAVVCLACGSGDPADDIVFVQPTRYVVQQGDDVARIARIHKVDVVEVLEWNNLLTDAPDVGSTLLIWPHGAVAASAAGDPTVVSTAPGSSAPRPRTGRPAPGAPPAAPEPAPPTDSPSVRPVTTVRGAGLLGAEDGSSGVDLEGASSGLQRHDSVNGAGLGDNSALNGGGEAETLRVEERQFAAPSGPQIPDKPVTPPRVSKPAPKKCLANTATQVDENGVVREAGLGTSQITAGMAAISRYTPQCFPSGTVGSYSLVVEVTVGCDGRVSNVYTVSPGSVPPRVTGCIEQTVSSAGFAAHGVPDGMSFQYPMKFKF